MGLYQVNPCPSSVQETEWQSGRQLDQLDCRLNGGILEQMSACLRNSLTASPGYTLG